MRASGSLGGGFDDPVFDAQMVFRAILDAMARPGVVREVPTLAAPPPPLGGTAGAILLALADGDTPVFLDASLADAAAVREWVRFHCGAPIVEPPGECALAVVSDVSAMPTLSVFPPGSPDYPDRSATVIVQIECLVDDPDGLTLRGPGIPRSRPTPAPRLPEEFRSMWLANQALYPRGVDIILAAPDAVAALPRTATFVR